MTSVLRKHILLVLLAVYSAVLYVAAYNFRLVLPEAGLLPIPVRTSAFTVSNDAGQGIFWANKWSEGAGFVENDLTVQFGELIRPWGYWAVYRVLCWLADPVTISRLLPLLLITICVPYIFHLLHRELGLNLAILGTVLVTTGSSFLLVFTGGHERAFRPLLLIICMFYLARERHKAAALAVFLGSVLYPPVFVLNAGLYFIYTALSSRFRLTSWRPALAWLAIAVAAGGAVTGLKSRQLAASPIAGPMYNRAEVLSMPEYGPEGRVPLATELMKPAWMHVRELYIPILSDMPTPAALDPFVSRLKSVGLTAARVLLMSVWLVFIVIRRPSTRLDYLLYALAATSVTLVELARMSWPLLYMPSRYAEGLLAPLLIVRLLHAVPAKYQRGLTVAMVATLPILLYLAPWKAGLNDYSHLASVYQTAARLDGPALIAAPPRLCDQIPVFSKKSCLVSYEFSGSGLFFTRYWPRLKRRTFDFFEAYTASEMTTVMDFVEKYGVDYLIIDRDSFGEERYFEPFQSFLGELQMGRDPDSYVLQRLDEKYVQQIDRRFLLVDARHLLRDREVLLH